jgi:hypothetical protein
MYRGRGQQGRPAEEPHPGAARQISESGTARAAEQRRGPAPRRARRGRRGAAIQRRESRRSQGGWGSGGHPPIEPGRARSPGRLPPASRMPGSLTTAHRDPGAARRSGKGRLRLGRGGPPFGYELWGEDPAHAVRPETGQPPPGKGGWAQRRKRAGKGSARRFARAAQGRGRSLETPQPGAPRREPWAAVLPAPQSRETAFGSWRARARDWRVRRAPAASPPAPPQPAAPPRPQAAAPSFPADGTGTAPAPPSGAGAAAPRAAAAVETSFRENRTPSSPLSQARRAAADPPGRTPLPRGSLGGRGAPSAASATSRAQERTLRRDGRDWPSPEPLPCRPA